MKESSRKFLRRVIQRDIRTHYTVSEMLECGHYFESFGMIAADPLTAKHRNCQKCAKQFSELTKKPPTPVPSPTYLRDSRRYEPPWKKTS